MRRFEEVYEFWFGKENPDVSMWFKKDLELDRQIRERFGPWLDAYSPQEFQEWKKTPQGLVSLVILLDQFPRNAYRGTARMFAYDQEALATAKEGLSKGWFEQLNIYEALFLCLPLEHSENLADQEECVRLAKVMQARATAEQQSFAAMTLDYAVRHRDIIAQFGRFPHRNEVLGRVSTPQEVEFLKSPGSSF